MTSLGNIFLGQYQAHSETGDKRSVAMLFRLSSKAFSRAVNSKKKVMVSAIFWAWRPRLQMTGALPCNKIKIQKKNKKSLLDWDLNPLPIIG